MGVPAHKVVDAVRNQFALSRAGEVVVECFDGLRGEGLAGAVKVPQQFLLLRVDVEDRLVCVLELAPQPGNVLELSVAIRMVSHRFLLPCRAASDLELSQQTTDHAPTGRSSQVDQPALQFSQRQIRAQHADAQPIARREFLKSCLRFASSVGRDSISTRRPPLFFRTRPTAESSGSPNSGSSPAGSPWYRTPGHAKRTPHCRTPTWPYTVGDPSTTTKRTTRSFSGRSQPNRRPCDTS